MRATHDYRYSAIATMHIVLIYKILFYFLLTPKLNCILYEKKRIMQTKRNIWLTALFRPKKKKFITVGSNRECGKILSSCTEFVYYETYRDIKSFGVSHDRRYQFPQNEYLVTNKKLFAC